MQEKSLRVLEFYKIRDMLVERAASQMGKERCAALVPSNDYEEILGADDLPEEKAADNTPATAPEPESEQEPEPEPSKKKAAPKKKQEQTALTADDLIRVVTQKIKQSRANKEKVLALLKSYGAAKVSDIPQDQYEAFLTDVSQL